jgi:hypothetical protein
MELRSLRVVGCGPHLNSRNPLRASHGEGVPKRRGADALGLCRGVHEEHCDLRGVSAVVRWVSVCGRRLDRAEAGHLVSARATSHNRQRQSRSSQSTTSFASERLKSTAALPSPSTTSLPAALIRDLARVPLCAMSGAGVG